MLAFAHSPALCRLFKDHIEGKIRDRGKSMGYKAQYVVPFRRVTNQLIRYSFQKLEMGFQKCMLWVAAPPAICYVLLEAYFQFLEVTR